MRARRRIRARHPSPEASGQTRSISDDARGRADRLAAHAPGHAVLIAAILVAGSLAVYGRVGSFEFVNFDDNVYVTENPPVLAGLTPGGIVWAFTTFHASNWHPLTWLSLMLDAEIGGAQPGVYHVTNLVLHLLATLFLFFSLRRMTGRDWPSGFVAGLFALHPLHVESVAWIAERKDALSAVFWFLTMLAYARYAEHPHPRRLLPVALTLGLGLMAKPMLVTLPVVLLLLDFWPLGRIALRGLPALVIEKVPLFGLSLASGAVTLLAQSRGGAVKTFETYAFGDRAANALFSVASYLLRTFWPANLAVFYPHPHGALSVWQIAGSALLVGGATVAALWLGRQRPWLATGWFWYLITLLPVIGLVQVGEQARADRYTYIPLVGIFLLVVWEALALARRARAPWTVAPRVAGVGPEPRVLIRDEPTRGDHLQALETSPAPRAGTPRRPSATSPWLAAAAFAVILPLAGVAYVQNGYWRDSITLFEHAVAVTNENRIAQNNLGSALFQKGRVEEAVAHFIRAIEIDPGYADAHANLAGARLQQGRLEEAIAQGREALRLRPDTAAAHTQIALALIHLGKNEEAAAHLAEELRSNPDNAGAHMNLGVALMLLGRREEAIAQFSEAVRLDPRNLDSRLNLGAALVESGRVEEGTAQIQEVLREHPGDARALHYLEIMKAGKATLAPRSLGPVEADSGR